MDGKIIAGVVFISVALLVIGITFTAKDEPRGQTLPWQIEQTPQQATRVFGLTLGVSTLQEAEARLQAVAETSLFAGDDGALMAEAYFDKITLGGLNAKMVAVLDIPPQTLQSLYQRGVRISTVRNGARKVTLSSRDQVQARHAPITSITYLPQTRLTETLLLKRFGAPDERIVEADNTTRHWLYPGRGLDIALSREGEAVLQYVNPSRFQQLKQPLLAKSIGIKP